ncbi:nuclear polyadenylated RNA-binding protein 3-like [Teleopsis dalmanni]|uniref:nuclear polyadenylated RNA-binding protein 3-like n=1 Tax=Teleopsis dalmanni TaxID=139649 RepID=UPI0018CFDE7F|nr:nuclear polyadenylated RNA-binding protein 3-like [Teleopsis dalmanni]
MQKLLPRFLLLLVVICSLSKMGMSLPTASEESDEESPEIDNIERSVHDLDEGRREEEDDDLDDDDEDVNERHISREEEGHDAHRAECREIGEYCMYSDQCCTKRCLTYAAKCVS